VRVRNARWRRIVIVGTALGAVLLLAGCLPENQGAVTLDEDTQLPKLVLTFCEGEGIEAVRLTEARLEDGYYEEGRTLWRIETAAPRPIPTVTAGDVPEGFREVVPLTTDLPDDVVMTAETGGGVAAEQGGGAFSVSELEPGVLFQDDARASGSDLRHNARTNCSSSLFGSMGLPPALDWAAAGAVGVAVIIGIVQDLRYRAKRRRGDRQDPPACAGDPANPAWWWRLLRACCFVSSAIALMVVFACLGSEGDDGEMACLMVAAALTIGLGGAGVLLDRAARRRRVMT
jgi:hypothetical protein